MTTVPTYARRLTRRVDPLETFRHLTDGAAADGAVLFETADATEGGRSLLMTRAALALRIDRDTARVQSLAASTDVLDVLQARLAHLGARRTNGGIDLELTHRPPAHEAQLDAPAFEVLRTFATAFSPTRADLDLFCLGALSFDLIDHTESLPQVARSTDDVVFYLPQELLVIDHDRGTLTVVEYDFASAGEFTCGARIAEVCEALETTVVTPPPSITAVEAEVDVDDVAFGGMVERARRHIVDGDVFQVVLSRSFQAPCPDPLAAYQVLRALNPSPYMFYFGGDTPLFGASPETSLRVTGDRVEIRPIAGTRRRGLHPDGTVDVDLDTRIEAELRLDRKELAEHMMLVDLARNDVARVTETGTRRVDRLLGVDRYSTVMHLVSHVSGKLRDGYDALHAYAAAMNMGTLSGAPKIRATEILRELEGTPRGFYGGAVGYITHRGDMDTAIVIRSATVADGVATVRAGAGIVHDSDPAAEADETRRKAQAVLTAIGASQQGAV